MYMHYECKVYKHESSLLVHYNTYLRSDRRHCFLADNVSINLITTVMMQ